MKRRKWKNGEEKEEREERARERERETERYGNESQSVQSSVRAQRVCDAHPVTRWFERKQVKCERSVSQADGCHSRSPKSNKPCDLGQYNQWLREIQSVRELPLDRGNALVLCIFGWTKIMAQELQLEIKTGDWKAVKPQAAAAVLYEPV